MRFYAHINDPILGSFGMTIDEDTMTWSSTPPGHDIREPMIGAYFKLVGEPPPGRVFAGKNFDVYPGGKVGPSK
jgi:hypothetical protein